MSSGSGNLETFELQILGQKSFPVFKRLQEGELPCPLNLLIFHVLDTDPPKPKVSCLVRPTAKKSIFISSRSILCIYSANSSMLYVSSKIKCVVVPCGFIKRNDAQHVLQNIVVQ